MEDAIASVQCGELKAAQAARKYNVKLSTLYDKIKGKHDGKRGSETLLSPDEELRMVSWIEENAKMGQPLSKRRFLEAALKISKLHQNGQKKFLNSGNSL